MDTRLVAAEYRMSHWAEKLRERQTRGVSIRSYCKSEGICENVYYYWQRKLREATCQEFVAAADGTSNQTIAPNGWAAVCGEKNAEIPAGSVRIEIGKYAVMVTSGSDLELVAKMCRMLVTIC